MAYISNMYDYELDDPFLEIFDEMTDEIQESFVLSEPLEFASYCRYQLSFYSDEKLIFLTECSDNRTVQEIRQKGSPITSGDRWELISWMLAFEKCILDELGLSPIEESEDC